MNRFSALRDVLTRASTWFALLAATSALYAAFGAKPKATWQVIKSSDAPTATTLPTNDVDHAPGDAIVYKGVPVDEQKQRELAEKIASALAVIFTVLAAATGQREEPPPPGGGGLTSSMLPGLTLGVAAAVLVSSGGCGNVAPGSDPVLVNAQRSRAVAWEGVTAFLDFDAANRAYVTVKLPAAHAFAEDLRRQVNPPDKVSPGVFDRANDLIDAYRASRSAADGEAMGSQLDRVAVLARAAREYLIQLQQRPPPAP